MIANTATDINQTEGVVLRTFPSGESDMVLRVLSPLYGKFSLLAKHIRSSKKRFSGNIEIFDRGIFLLNRRNSTKSLKNNLRILESFEAAHAAFSLRESLIKLSVASLLSEAFDLIIKEEQDNENDRLSYYETFILSLQAIEESQEKNDLLKTCFLSLKALMCLAGFIAKEQVAIPNKKNLFILLNHIEDCAEKKLLARELIDKMI